MDVRWLLGVVRDPLVRQGAFVGDELAESIGNLRLDGGAHEGDGDIHFVVVGQGGGVAIAGGGNGAAEVHRCALDISGVFEGEGVTVESADLHDTLDLQGLADHGAHCFGEQVERHDFVEDGLRAVEGVNLASLGGEVSDVVCPVVAIAQCCVHCGDGLINSHGVLCAGSHGDKTTVRCMPSTQLPQNSAPKRPLRGEELTQAIATLRAANPGLQWEDFLFGDATTLHCGGQPIAAVRCTTTHDVARAVRALDEAGVDCLIVGGGSNLVVADGELPLVAVVMDSQDITMDMATGVVAADAGVVWDDLVAATVDAGLGGLECLSGIPGTVGATPVQNVGAYGVEISDVVRRVQLYNRHTRQVEWVAPEALELSYRYSNVKFTQRAVVTRVEYQLRTDGQSAPLRFGQLATHLGVDREENCPRRAAADVRDAVLALRRSKGMVYDPADHDTWSAGSFFTNPIVDEATLEGVRAVVVARGGDVDTMPCFESQGGFKLSAAWLIDHAGFSKGYPGEDAPARLSTKHTLALTNRGQATAADIVALARDVRAGVQAVFGVTLEPEPVWVGVSIDG